MRRNVFLTAASVVLTVALWQSATFRGSSARAATAGTASATSVTSNRKICSTTTTPSLGRLQHGVEMYVSPLPVPPNVGHTYVTYQPFMPHEYTVRARAVVLHLQRRRRLDATNVRYGTCGNSCQEILADWHFPLSNNAWRLQTTSIIPGIKY